MLRCVCCLMTLVLLLCCTGAVAMADKLPQELLDHLAQDGYDSVRDVLLFDMPDGRRLS